MSSNPISVESGLPAILIEHILPGAKFAIVTRREYAWAMRDSFNREQCIVYLDDLAILCNQEVAHQALEALVTGAVQSGSFSVWQEQEDGLHVVEFPPGSESERLMFAWVLAGRSQFQVFNSFAGGAFLDDPITFAAKRRGCYVDDQV